MAKVYGSDKAPGDRVFLPGRAPHLPHPAGRTRSGSSAGTSTRSSLLAFSLVSVLALYLFQRVQTWLPLANGLPNVVPKMAFNTAVSFVTNTNWQ